MCLIGHILGITSATFAFCHEGQCVACTCYLQSIQKYQVLGRIRRPSECPSLISARHRLEQERAQHFQRTLLPRNPKQIGCTPTSRKSQGHAWDHRGRDGALEVERVQHVAQYAFLNLRAHAHHWPLHTEALTSCPLGAGHWHFGAADHAKTIGKRQPNTRALHWHALTRHSRATCLMQPHSVHAVWQECMPHDTLAGQKAGRPSMKQTHCD